MRGKVRMRDERGIVLIVALMLLLVLTVIGISSISTTSFESIISGNERLANIAFYSAEAGIQAGLNRVPLEDDMEPLEIPKSEIGPDTTYRTTVIYVGGAVSPGDDVSRIYKRYQVNATGDALGGNRQVEVQARLGPYPAGTDYNN